VNRRKVCVVVTARPSYSRIKTAMLAIRGRPDLELQVVVASSAMLDRYGNAIKVIRADGFDVDATVCNVLEGEDLRSMSKTTGLGIIELSTVFDTLKPDVVVTVADRFETMATAVAAAYMNIPLCHVQGGEVTGSIDEKVRHAITKLSDLHLVSTEKARERVIKLGEDPAMVHVTGCPSIDLAAEILAAPALDFDPLKKYGGVGVPLDLSNGYLVVMQHPVTTEYEASRKHVTETLHAINELAMPTYWFWPNVDAGADGTSKGIRAFRELMKPSHIHFFKNMEPHDFLRLLFNCRALIGNSSVAIRECSFLGVPAVNIGSRQDGRERGRNVVDVSYDRRNIEAAVRQLLECPRPESDRIYGDGRAGERIAAVLAKAPLRIEKRLSF
jgi:UDP-hydrolysing UDP-N-acetyl-D-glucosamine 2-epimerase